MHNFSFILVPVLPSYNNLEEICQHHLGRNVPLYLQISSLQVRISYPLTQGGKQLIHFMQ